MMHVARGTLLGFSLVWLGMACSASGTDSNGALGAGNGTSSGAASSSGGSATSSGGSASSSGGSTSNGATGGTTVVDVDLVAGGATGDPETCDGVDNDGDGIVDDVDVGNDGVCDCLNVATIGHIGPWSDGTGIFAQWLSDRSPLGAIELENQILTDDLLKPFQVIVMLHTEPKDIYGTTAIAPAYHGFSDEESAVLARWVENGGGLMTTMGYDYCCQDPGEETNVNKGVAGIGFGYTVGGGEEGYITDWVAHPVTDGVTNIFTEHGIEVDGRGTVLAHDPNGKAALQVIEYGTGHAVMWGDEWITYDSLWVDIDTQQVERFWLNILKWLSPEKQCQVPIPVVK